MKCFQYNNQNNKNCSKNNCRYWIDDSKNNNCCLIASSNDGVNSQMEKFTLQDIGDIFKVTRMRICQIEKIAIKKLKDKFSNFE
jgi:hypothetical protein